MTVHDPSAPPEPDLAAPGPPPARPWGPWATLLLSVAVFAAYSVVQTAAMVVLLLFDPELLKQLSAGKGFQVTGLQFAVATLVGAPVGVALVAGLIGMRRAGTIRGELGWHWPPRRAVLLSLLALGAYLAAYDLLTRFMDRPAAPEFMVDAYQTAVIPALLWAGVGIAAPLFEEVLFRGFLLPGLARGPLGGIGAVLLSSVLFALPHLQYDLFDMTAVFGLGLLFAAARLRTGSTLLAFVLHAVTNLLATAQVALYLS